MTACVDFADRIERFNRITSNTPTEENLDHIKVGKVSEVLRHRVGQSVKLKIIDLKDDDGI